MVQQRANWDRLRTFANQRQHDANEAFCTLLRACDDVDFQAFKSLGLAPGLRENSPSAYTTPHWKLFGALVLETTRCSACPHQIRKHEVCTSFSVALPRCGAPEIETLFANTLGDEPLCSEGDHCEQCLMFG